MRTKASNGEMKSELVYLVSVEHLISIDSVDYRITPTRLTLGSPSVIRRLCSEAAVHIGDMRVIATPYPRLRGVELSTRRRVHWHYRWHSEQ
jgi:hypothetical protein